MYRKIGFEVVDENAVKETIKSIENNDANKSV